VVSESFSARGLRFIWEDGYPDNERTGSDTTSSTMSAVMFYLLHHPEWHARAVEEVRSTFASDEEILLGPALSSCKVLLACIDESQRLTPTAPNGPPRVVDAGGITIDGHHLPEGTVVNVPIYHVQREAAYFVSPDRFEPDRWMTNKHTADKDIERIKHQQKAHMPFHIGPRSCKSCRPCFLCSTVVSSLHSVSLALHSQVKLLTYDMVRSGLEISKDGT
jgi:hypothetical protein